MEFLNGLIIYLRVIVVGFFTTHALATTFYPSPYMARFRSAPFVLLGEYQESVTRWVGQPKALKTVHQFKVKEWVKPAGGQQQIWVEMLGGRLGQVEVKIGTPVEFQAGNHYFLTLNSLDLQEDVPTHFSLIDSEASVMDARPGDGEKWEVSGGLISLDPKAPKSVSVADIKSLLSRPPSERELEVYNTGGVEHNHEADERFNHTDAPLSPNSKAVENTDSDKMIHKNLETLKKELLSQNVGQASAASRSDEGINSKAILPRTGDRFSGKGKFYVLGSVFFALLLFVVHRILFK